MLVKVADPKNPVEVKYETFDILKVTYPEKTVTETLKTKEGNLAIITGGKNIGKQGKIVEIEKTEAKKRRQALVLIEDAKGQRYQTIMDFIFSIGEAAPNDKHIGGIQQVSEETMIKNWEEHPMLKPQIEKVVVNLNVGKSGEPLEKANKVLKEITGHNPVKKKAKATIRDFGIREGESNRSRSYPAQARSSRLPKESLPSRRQQTRKTIIRRTRKL